jgi:hypoxanthine phosphoribosyltransferase
MAQPRRRTSGHGEAAARRPTIFLASSTEARQQLLQVGRWIEEAGAEAKPWTRSFGPGTVVFQELTSIAQKVDGVVVLLTPDDLTTSRGRQSKTPRNNLLFELGVFVGALPASRVALVRVSDDKGRPPLLPSDLNGLTCIDVSAQSTVGAESQIHQWIRAEFFIRQSLSEPQLETRRGKPYSWDDIIRGVEHIQHRIENDQFLPAVVVGLGRSGGVVGGLLASYLGSLPFQILDLRYRATRRGYDVDISDCRRALTLPDTVRRAVVVEGATTGGVTPTKALDALEQAFPSVDFRFAVLIQTATSSFRSDYYAFLEQGSLTRLPWHGPKSRRFLSLVNAK